MANPETRNDGLWQQYKATWPKMFLIQSITLIVGLSVAGPVICQTTSRALVSSSQSVLSDVNLLEILLGPNFPLMAFSLITIWSLIHIFGYSAQLFVAHAASHGLPISVFAAFAKTGRSCIPLVQLSLSFFLQLFIIALPFLLVIVGVLYLQVQKHSLTYYLSHQPPEFILAITFALLLLTTMTAVLITVTLRRMLALPLVLFEAEKPSIARHISRKKSRSIHRRAFTVFAIWAIATPLLAILLNSGWIPLSLWASEAIGHRIGLLSLSLSVMLLVAVGIALLVGFVSLTILALQHVQLFSLSGLDIGDTLQSAEPAIPAPIKFGLAALVFVAALLTVVLSFRSLKDFRINDHAVLISQRGASNLAPENSIAAIALALEQGADGVSVDLRRSADKTLVVFKDSDFTRITGEPLKINEATMDDLSRIDIGSWKHPKFHEERVPTLRQVIKLCGRNSTFIIYLPDIQGSTERATFFREVADTINTSAISRQIRVVCSRLGHIADYRSIVPNESIGFHSPDMIDGPIGVPVDFLIVPAATLSAELINKLHSQKIEVFAADTADAVTMSAVLSRGADGLLLTKPSLGRRVLEDRADLNPGERLLIEMIARLRERLPSS